MWFLISLAIPVFLSGLLCGSCLPKKQDTGYKDRNGKSIGVGDVLKSYEGILWKVHWNAEEGKLELVWHGGPQSEYYRFGMYHVQDVRCEIVEAE